MVLDISFLRKNWIFLLETTEIDGSVNEYKVAYVFGLTPLQQYIIDFKDGKKAGFKSYLGYT